MAKATKQIVAKPSHTLKDIVILVPGIIPRTRKLYIVVPRF
jgi:hypothetical protein